jgi:uncharacterized protein YlxW (UPF0749 family)
MFTPEVRSALVYIGIFVVAAALLLFQLRRNLGETLRKVLFIFSVLLTFAFSGLTFQRIWGPLTQPPENVELARLEKSNRDLKQEQVALYDRAESLKSELRDAKKQAESAITAAMEAGKTAEDERTRRRLAISHARRESQRSTKLQVRIESLLGEYNSLEMTISDLRSKIGDLEAQISAGVVTMEMLTRRLNSEQMKLASCNRRGLLTQARASIQSEITVEAKVLSAKWEEQYRAAVVSACSTAEQRNRAPTAQSGTNLEAIQFALRLVGIGQTNEFFTVKPSAGVAILSGRAGVYYEIILRPEDRAGKFRLDKVEPTLLPSEGLFNKAATALAEVIIKPLTNAGTLELLVRGKADNRGFKQRPDDAKILPYIKYDGYDRIAEGSYSSKPSSRTIALPLQKRDLGNVRGAYLASLLNNQMRNANIKIPVLVLDSPAEDGTLLEPHFYLFIPASY